MKDIQSSKYIGINYNGCHDSNITYFSDKVEYALSEERFSRVKKDGRPPNNCLRYLGSKLDLSDKTIKYVFPILPIHKSKRLWEKEGLEDVYDQIKDKLSYGIDYARQFTNRPIFVSHLNAHAASAYFTSGYTEKSLVLTIDAGNYSDPYCIAFYEGKNGKLSLLEKSTDNSIAQGYLLVTALLGFRPMLHEGKITGLAAYGQRNCKAIKDLRSILEDPEFVFQATRWEGFGGKKDSPRLICTEAIEKARWFTEKYTKEDISFAIQYITEEKVRNLLEVYGGKYKRICLAGGLFANVTLNRKIQELGFEQIFIHPAMGDDGLSLGAILFAKAEASPNGLKPFTIENAYWGANYDSSESVLEPLFHNYHMNFEKPEHIESEIARYLAEGKIVARFQGRMEYGPRALGHRSILYRADDPDINLWLNKKLNRTEFMPFAPVVLDTMASKLFNGFAAGSYAAQFMTITFHCTDLMKSIAPAAVHIDGTARPQIITKETNKSYYEVVEIYNRIVREQSILINTSFNMHGEPIVLTPEDALKSFLASELDILAIEDYIVFSRQG